MTEIVAMPGLSDDTWIVTDPGPMRLSTPCRIAFSTSGWMMSFGIGTCMSPSSAAIRQFSRSIRRIFMICKYRCA